MDASLADLSSSPDPWPAAATAPGAPVRLGLLVNPHARGLRRPAALASLHEAAGGVLTAVTASVGEVAGAVERLVRSGVNVLAVAGGDGALHHALQGLLRGERRWPGRVLLLPAGTLNIVARTVAPGRSATGGLVAFRERWGRGVLGALPARPVPVLRVVGEGLGERHGFLFGSEAVKNSLELYDRFGGGYEGLSRFLLEVGRGYLLNTPLWQQEKWRLTPVPGGVRLVADGRARELGGYAAVIAATVDLALGHGAIRTLRRDPADRGFFARVITETRTGPLLAMIPGLMRGHALDAVVDAPTATALHLHGSYTLDGECVGVSARLPERPRALRVEAAGEVAFV